MTKISTLEYDSHFQFTITIDSYSKLVMTFPKSLVVPPTYMLIRISEINHEGKVYINSNYKSEKIDVQSILDVMLKTLNSDFPSLVTTEICSEIKKAVK